MKKLLFGAAALFLLASCAGKSVLEKTNEDQSPSPDSMVQTEEAIDTDEQAQQDSIARVDEQAKLDSLAREDKMRLTTSIFWSYSNNNNNDKKLKKYGFKKIKEINIPDEEGIDEYKAVYSRVLNGRRIDYVDYQESCCSETIIFYDERDKEAFIQQLKKEGFKRQGSEYSHPNKYYPIVISGNKAELINCG